MKQKYVYMHVHIYHKRLSGISHVNPLQQFLRDLILTILHYNVCVCRREGRKDLGIKRT